MKKNKKSKSARIFDILGALVILLLCLFNLYEIIRNVRLLINHQSINVTITKVDSKFHRRTTTKNIYYSYNSDGSLETGFTSIDLTLIDSIFWGKYNPGDKETVFVGKNNFSNFKKEIPKTITSNTLQFALWLFISITWLSLDSSIKNIFFKKKENCFYIQDLKSKIKYLDIHKIKIDDYIKKLADKEIICLGFSFSNNFFEYSYDNGIFFERVFFEDKEKMEELQNSDLADERIKNVYRKMVFRK